MLIENVRLNSSASPLKWSVYASCRFAPRGHTRQGSAIFTCGYALSKHNFSPSFSLFLFTATLGYSSTFSRPFSHSAWFYSFFLSFSALSLSIFLFLWGRPERVELTLDHRRWPPACFPRAKWTVEGHNGEAHRGTLGGKTSNQTQIKLIK